MKDFINKNFVSLLVLALMVVLYLQKCGDTDAIAPIEKHDTTIVEKHYYHDSTIVSKPVVYNTIPPKKGDIPVAMIPDSNYGKLRMQYDSLLTLHYSQNISRDSINIDSIGSVATIDTTQGNRIIGRKWSYHFDIKERTITIDNTIYPPQKFQVYVGLGVMGEQDKLVNGVEVGMLLKNRKDQMFGLSAQKQIGIPIEYTLSTYWKLHIGKKSP